MTWTELQAFLDEATSNYVADRELLMKGGQYLSNDHFKDGYIGMIIETLQEVLPEDDYFPLDVNKVRALIYTFNRLTYQRVPDIWTAS
jgi:hypothetical protein